MRLWTEGKKEEREGMKEGERERGRKGKERREKETYYLEKEFVLWSIQVQMNF